MSQISERVITDFVWSKSLRCFKCQGQIDIKEKRPYFMHDSHNIKCKQVMCIWCCYQVVKAQNDQYKNYRVKQPGGFAECCGIWIPNLIQHMVAFLDQNCVLCGYGCRSERFNLDQNGKLHVGRQCYMKISQILFILRSNQQHKMMDEIKKLTKSKCSLCGKDEFNKMKATKLQIESQICKNCAQKSQKLQAKNQEKIKQCESCLQKDIWKSYSSLNTLFRQQKVLSIVYFSTDSRNSYIYRYCAFCLYQRYLQLQKEYFESNLDPEYYWNLKIRYQQFFRDQCMVCALKISSKKDKVNLIFSKYEQSIKAFICNRCGQHLKNDPKKFVCFQKLIGFLKDTKQYPLISHQMFEKKQVYQSANRSITRFQKSIMSSRKQNHHQIKRKQVPTTNMMEQGDFDDYQEVKSTPKLYKNDPIFWPDQTQTKQASELINPNLNISNSKVQQIEMTDFTNRRATQRRRSSDGQFKQIPFEEGHPKQQIQPRSSKQLLTLDRFPPLSRQDLEPLTRNPLQISQQIISDILYSSRPINEDNLLSEILTQTLPPQHQPPPSNPITLLKPRPCAFFNQCRNKQKILNLDKMCGECFAKYLLGDREIVRVVGEVVSNKENSGVLQRTKNRFIARQQQRRNQIFQEEEDEINNGGQTFRAQKWEGRSNNRINH